MASRASRVSCSEARPRGSRATPGAPSSWCRRHHGQATPAEADLIITSWRWVIGIAILAGLVALVVSRFAEEAEFLELARRVEPWWLGVAALLQAGTYLCAAGVLKLVLARAGTPLPLRSLARLALAKLFVDQAVPSGGISGTLLVIRGLQQHGVSRSIAVSVMVVDNLAYYAAYLAVIGVSLAVIWDYHDLHIAVLALAALVVLLAVCVPAAILWVTGPRPRRIPRWVHRFRRVDELLCGIAESAHDLVRDRRLLVRASALQIVVFLLDAATLEAMLWAIGHPARPGPAFASFVVATMAATVGPTPGGLGTFEGTSIGMLALFGVRIEAALEATLLLRGFTFWLPMLPGLWVARREAARHTSAAPGPGD
jgi:uncharacterized protein (TIRG00374 family)